MGSWRVRRIFCSCPSSCSWECCRWTAGGGCTGVLCIAPCRVSADGDVINWAVRLTWWGHFYVLTGAFSHLSLLVVQGTAGSSVLVLETGVGHTIVELQGRCWLCYFSHTGMTPGSGLCCWCSGAWSLSCQTRKSCCTSDKANEDCSVTPAV